MADVWLRLRSGNPGLRTLPYWSTSRPRPVNYDTHPGATYEEAHRAANVASNWQNQIPAPDLRGLLGTVEVTVGMMVVGRKVAESVDEVRYEFGLDREFDRVLTIDKHTWQATAEDGHFDSAAGAVASKIKRSWQERGEFPPGVVFAS